MSYKNPILIKSQKAVGNYSAAAIDPTTGLVFTAGQIAYDHLDLDIEGQTKETLNNLVEVLKSAGTDLKKILKVTIYLTNMKNFKTVNIVYGDFWHELGETKFPARSCIEVSALPLGALIEIEAVAMLAKK